MFPKLSVVAAALCLLQVVSVYASQPNGAQCSGIRQSPIDLDTRSLSKARVAGVFFNSGYSEVPATQTVQSDGHSIVILSNNENVAPRLTGGPLSTDYKLHSIHFHWGTDNNVGSEHTVNGKAYPMEMHVVHTKNDLSFEEAKNSPNGLAVIGYFIDVSNNEVQSSNNPFVILTNTINTLTAKSTPVDMLTKFAINKLVVPFNYGFISYEGSLTTGDCNEVVSWIIAPKILKMTNDQINVFRSLHDKHLVEEANNYRYVQPMNSRRLSLVERPKLP